MGIERLSPILANQIAAGEVVERPASVVKELLENSLDAGATRIEVDIERGGHKRICLRDNGRGIAKEELELALSRHATSKIHTLDDLEAIVSLGFRGEALASISSVSRLVLTSKPAEQAEAWQAFAEGNEQAVKTQPAAHPDGTTVDIQDLFFNTPARRKFLRTEKTEFTHIDTLIKRIALSQFEVAFTLKHNGKRVRHYPAAKSQAARDKRVGLVCGGSFMTQALRVDSDYQGLRLHGWFSPVLDPQPDHQYVYVNGRMMRDKLINHALRQAITEHLSNEGHAGYVLFLSLDPKLVDVNVHPAKHEVRFHQARLVHDFLYRVMTDVLSESVQPQEQTYATTAKTLDDVAPAHDYIRPLTPQIAEGRSAYRPSSAPAGPSRGASQSYQALMTPSTDASSAPSSASWLRIDAKHAVLTDGEQGYVLKLQAADQAFLCHQLSEQSVSQPLLMPIAVSSDQAVPDALMTQLESIGVVINVQGQRVMVKQVPAGLRQLDWSGVMGRLLSLQTWSIDIIAEVLANSRRPLSDNDCWRVLAWHQQEYPTLSTSPHVKALSIDLCLGESND